MDATKFQAFDSSTLLLLWDKNRRSPLVVPAMTAKVIPQKTYVLAHNSGTVAPATPLLIIVLKAAKNAFVPSPSNPMKAVMLKCLTLCLSRPKCPAATLAASPCTSGLSNERQSTSVASLVKSMMRMVDEQSRLG
jgi:hypothetical protein